MSSRGWTPEHLELLRQHYAVEGAHWVAQQVGKQKKAVNAQAKRLGLRGKGYWTTEEENFLKNHYTSHGSWWVAQELGRSQTSIQDKARKLGVLGRGHWLEEEVIFLVDHYARHDTRWIAEQLKMSFERVRFKAEALGLTKESWTFAEEAFLVENYGIVSNQEIATKLGKTKSAIYGRANVLKLTRKGKSQATLPERLVATALDNLQIIYQQQVKILTNQPSAANWPHCYWPDFMIGKYLVLEVYGDYWHCNPVIYPNGPIHEQQAKIVARDARKHQFYHNNGYQLLIIWETDTYNTQSLLTLLTTQLAPHIGNDAGITARIAGTGLEPLCHNVTQKGGRDGLKSVGDCQISSRASWEQEEGSTTRAWSPDRTVKPHEYAAPNKGEDIV